MARETLDLLTVFVAYPASDRDWQEDEESTDRLPDTDETEEVPIADVLVFFSMN